MMSLRRCLVVVAAVLALAGPCLASRSVVNASSWGGIWGIGQPNATFSLNDTLYFARNWEYYPMDSIAYGWAQFDLSDVPAATACTLSFVFTPLGEAPYCQGVRIDSVGVYQTLPGTLHDWWVDLSSAKQLADKTPLPPYAATILISLDPAKLDRRGYFTLGWDADPNDNVPFESWGRGAVSGGTSPQLIFRTP